MSIDFGNNEHRLENYAALKTKNIMKLVNFIRPAWKCQVIDALGDS